MGVKRLPWETETEGLSMGGEKQNSHTKGASFPGWAWSVLATARETCITEHLLSLLTW